MSNKSKDDNFWPLLGTIVKNAKRKKLRLAFIHIYVISSCSRLSQSGSLCLLPDTELVGGDLPPIYGGGGLSLERATPEECASRSASYWPQANYVLGNVLRTPLEWVFNNVLDSILHYLFSLKFSLTIFLMIC